MTQTLTLLTRLRTLTDAQTQFVLAYLVGRDPKMVADAIALAVEADDE